MCVFSNQKFAFHINKSIAFKKETEQIETNFKIKKIYFLWFLFIKEDMQ